MPVLPRDRRMLAYGAAAGFAVYLLLWLTVAAAFEQDPLLLRARDVGPFLSGASAFAAAGLLAGALAEAGRVRTVAGAAAGAVAGYAAATLHVLYPYALSVTAPAVGVLAAGAALGGACGLVADAAGSWRQQRRNTRLDPDGAAGAGRHNVRAADAGRGRI